MSLALNTTVRLKPRTTLTVVDSADVEMTLFQIRSSFCAFWNSPYVLLISSSLPHVWSTPRS